MYRLRAGHSALAEVRYAFWFSKPPGTPYDDFFRSLSASAEEAGGGLWQRQMVLGPAPEFCLLTTAVLALPEALDPLVLDVESV